MKFFAIAALAALLPAVALAADAPSAQPSSTLVTLDGDWQAFNVTQKHLFDDILALAKENAVLKAENDKLKADAAEKAKPNVTSAPTK